MMVHPDSHRISRVLWYSGTGLGHFSFQVREYHPLCSSFQRVPLTFVIHVDRPTTPADMSTGLAYSPFARRY